MPAVKEKKWSMFDLLKLDFLSRFCTLKLEFLRIFFGRSMLCILLNF